MARTCSLSIQIGSFTLLGQLPQNVAVFLHHFFCNFHDSHKLLIVRSQENAFRSFSHVKGITFGSAKLCKDFFGQDDADGTANGGDFDDGIHTSSDANDDYNIREDVRMAVWWRGAAPLFAVRGRTAFAK